MQVRCDTRCFDSTRAVTFYENETYNLTDEQVKRFSEPKLEGVKLDRVGKPIPGFGTTIPGYSFIEQYFTPLEPGGQKYFESLVERDAAAVRAQPVQETPTAPVMPLGIQLEDLTVDKLKSMAKEQGLELNSKAKKQEIVAALRGEVPPPTVDENPEGASEGTADATSGE